MLPFLRVLMMFAAVAFAFAGFAGSRVATAAAPTPVEGCMKQWLMQDGVQTSKPQSLELTNGGSISIGSFGSGGHLR